MRAAASIYGTHTMRAPVCRKNIFSTDWQRLRKAQRQSRPLSSAYIGTVESGLRSKPKCLAKQAYAPTSVKKSRIFVTFSPGRRLFCVYYHISAFWRFATLSTLRGTHTMRALRLHSESQAQTKENSPAAERGRRLCFIGDLNQTSSMTAISAASPRRGPVRVTLV